MATNTANPPQALNQANVASGRRRVFWFGIIVVAIIVVAIFSVAFYTAKSAENEFEDATRQEMRSIAFNRASEINNWLKGVMEQTARFTNSSVIKDFAVDVDAMGDHVTVLLNSTDPADRQRSEMSDISLLQSYLNNFVAYSDFNFGGMLNSRGEMYINTDPAYQSLDSRQRTLAAEVVKSGEIRFGNVRPDTTRGLLFEIYLPVVSLTKNEQGGFNTVAVLYLTQSISPKLNDLFTMDGYASQGYLSYLLQKVDGTWQNVSFRQDRVREIPAMSMDEENNIPFGIRDSVVAAKKVYSQGSKVADLDWWVLWELDYAQARGALDSRISDIYMLAALSGLALILLVSVIWRWFISMERSHTLNQFQELFKVIEDQKLLLDSINGTISEPICLTDASGVFLYVNQAFADAFGRDISTIPGLDTAAVYGFDTAKRLNVSDQHVLMTGETVTTNEIIWLQSKRHYFQISKSPQKNPEIQAVTGIVSVYRDITKLHEAEERGHRVVQQTIDALVSTIEQADPFLGGHSRIMGEVAKMIAKNLHLTDKDTATIETAATLSQIGKMFVPRDVLTKPGVLTPEEKKVMEEHVHHTLEALSKIEFDLPVLDAIAQMNERLDGKGYPENLSGEEIGIHARVLAVANAFTAMARPRSYRPAMDVETALSVLEKQSGSYDQSIVHVLREVLHTPAGEKLVAQAASSKPV